MIATNPVGLEKTKVSQVAELLNDLLANYQVFYQNIRGFHWNIKGKDFFTLHVKFEELYNEAQENIDVIAERIRALGETPFHTYSKYLEESEIKEIQNVSDATGCVQELVKDISILLKKEREVIKVAADANDEGTVNFISDYVTNQEKALWMLTAYLGR